MNFLHLPEWLYEVPSEKELCEIYKEELQRKIATRIINRLVFKSKLAESQNYHCCYCGQTTNNVPDNRLQATIEHVIPKARQGSDDFNNLVMSCNRCNQKRKIKYIEEELLVG